MEFRLTYEGRLGATQRDPLEGKPPRHTEDRRNIRQAMHVQMRRLWQDHPALNGEGDGRSAFLVTGSSLDSARTIEQLAHRHAHYGYNFVPLVTQEMDLLCNIDVLFLRPDRPGKVWAGDIDNRIKTLLDALRIPESGEGYSDTAPTRDQQPFFCLLEDDRLITGLSVETDRLLEPVDGSYDPKNVRLIISVQIKPFVLHVDNMHFG